MPYEITIKKTSTVTSVQDGEYTVIDRRPWTDEELKASSRYYGFGDTKGAEFLQKEPLKEIRGYAPSKQANKKVETEVLKQTVDDLDLAAVIKAINKL